MKKALLAMLMVVAILSLNLMTVSASLDFTYGYIGRPSINWVRSNGGYTLFCNKTTEFSRFHYMKTNVELNNEIWYGDVVVLETSTTLKSTSFAGFKGKYKVELLDKNGVVLQTITSEWYGVKLLDARDTSKNYGIPIEVAKKTNSIKISHYKE